MPDILVKGQPVRFPDGTPPDVMEKSIRETFFSIEEQAKMTTFPEREGYRLRKGRSTVDVGRRYWDAMEGRIPDEAARKFDDKTMKQFTPEDDVRFAAQNTGEKFVGATTELLPYMGSSLYEGMRQGTLLGSALAGAAFVAGTPVLIPAATVGGFAIGQAYGTITNAARVEGGNLYGTLLKEGIDRKIAARWSIAGGYLIGAVEAFQINHLLGGTLKLGRKSITQFVVNEARKKTPSFVGNKVLNIGGKLLGKLAKTTALEVLEEDVQEVITLGSEAGAHMESAMRGLGGGEGPTFQESKQRIFDTTKYSLLAFPLLGLPGSVASTASGMRSVGHPITNKAKEAFREDLVDLIEESKKFETVDEFIKETPVDISREESGLIGFDNQELLMQGVYEQGQREIAEDEAEKIAKAEPALGIATEKVIRQTELTEEERTAFPELAKLEEQVLDTRSQIEQAKRARGKEGRAKREALQNQLDKLLATLGVKPGEKIRKAPAVKRVLGVEEKLVMIKETTLLKQRIQTLARGVREGTIKTKKDVKAVQAELTDFVQQSKLEAKDKAKFLQTIKNIQTQEQLQKTFPEVRERIDRLVEAAEKRDVSAKIKKELRVTKPLKVGQKRVGKFDFQTNKLFDTLRGFNKLTQEKAQAEFDKFPEEVTTEVDLIKKRFLSLKANGTAASAEIHNQVLADIKEIKQLGKEAKNETDLIKALNKEVAIELALESIDRIKANKKTVKTIIGNIYRKGFSNIYSMFNSIAGKDFAEGHDPELSENRRNTATYKSTLNVTLGASKIYNQNNIMKLFETMSVRDYEITDVKDGLTTELSKLELIDIYNSLKNEKKKEDYFEAFGEDQVQNLMAKLTSNDEAFGNLLQESVQSYREVLNKRNIEITGRDLGFVENYWPATSEFQVSVLDDLRVQGETPSALKERAKTRVIPVPKNAWYKTQRHIAQAEHVANLSREFERLKRLFTDRRVKHAVEAKFGEDVYKTIIAQIDNLSLNKQTERIDAISSIFQKAINNWVTAKIAINPSTYVRQLMSVGNYIEKMNVAEWNEGFWKGISSPKKTFEFVWKNAPFLEARFNKGFSEALKEAIEGAERISTNKSLYTKFLTALVRSGDVTAIIYGGFPLIQSELKAGKSMKEAIDTFEKATLKAQQSGLSSSVSQFQNSRNPFSRLFLAFKNTSNQYFRKMVDAVISFQNGDISLTQFTKTMAIYAVIQPILYASAGFATKVGFSFLGRIIGLREEDEDFEDLLEKFLNDMIISLVVSPVNAIPIIDDVMRTAARKLTGQKIYKVFSTPLFDDLETGLRALTKKEVTGADYFKSTTSILEPVTALPIKTGIRYFEILTGKKVGGKKKKRKTRF